MSEIKEEELIATGWHLATISGGDHLQRALSMYRELGFSIHLIETEHGNNTQCTVCYQNMNEPVFKMYTRSLRDQNSKS